MNDIDRQHLKTAIRVSQQARDHGNHPFGAILVDDNGVVIMEVENTVLTERDCTGHAETNLVRMASSRFAEKNLAKCTLYASTEPCAMCAAAIFWSGVGRLVYALSQGQLHQIIGASAGDYFLFLNCREVLSKGSRPVEVLGPFLENEAKKVHEGYWKK
ncbi:MAG: tRNA-specific adenosine deaminase [bacterium]|nr:tRNA-specific adenosine deaminase [bacterium]